MRVGALAASRLKDMEYLEEFKLYKFKVYADAQLSERYITYCTPECAYIIKNTLNQEKNKVIL